MTATDAAIDPASRGKAARKAKPRATQAVFGNGEPRDPVGILTAQAVTRVPELVPVRYARMLASPFAFYRGAAAIMAADLATVESTGLTVQLCGDAHLANFGGFSSPERSLIFDLNDFDETLPGPFEWDLKRLVASFAVAGRFRGFTPLQRRDLVLAVTDAYCHAMKGFAAMARLDVWHQRMDAADLERRLSEGVGSDTLARLKRAIAKASKRDSGHAFNRYTEVGPDGALRPINQPPLVVPIEDLVTADELPELERVVDAALDSYRSSLSDDRRALLDGYRRVGIARKVVGVGSVGTRCWIVLLVAEDDAMDDLVIQVKEANASVLEPYLGASGYDHHGRRVVEGQRLMQAASDVLLGWERTELPGGATRDFYVRQMWDGKVSADLEGLPPDGFRTYAGICGWTLARAHAKSGDRKEIAGYLGGGATFGAALVTFAETYADQNESDFALLQVAADTKAIPVSPEAY